MTLALTQMQPFAMGGNRLCFVHPEHPNRCIKVRRPDFSLQQLRRSKGFPKSLRPLSSFDDNAEEFRTIRGFEQTYGKEMYEHICRYYGFEDTDLGKGLTSELVRDSNGKISYSLKQYIIENGLTPSVDNAIKLLSKFWLKHTIPSRALLPHNIVVQRGNQNEVVRLVVIDGLGDPNLIPQQWLPKALRRKKTAKKLADLRQRLNKLIAEAKAGKHFSDVGKLLHDGTTQNPN